MIAGALALAAVSASFAVHAESLGLEGQWRWNRVQSSSPAPGEAPPRDVLLVIESATPTRVRWELTFVDAAGGRHTTGSPLKGGVLLMFFVLRSRLWVNLWINRGIVDHSCGQAVKSGDCWGEIACRAPFFCKNGGKSGGQNRNLP